MKALSLTAVVPVTDLDTAIKYYTEVLGFCIDFKLTDYAGLIYDEAALYLSGQTIQGIKKPVGGALFCIDCDELQL